MLSFPHFYLGDPRLLEAVEGLNPDPEKHDSFLDVHEVRCAE
jgi:CD36 family.